MRNVRVTLIRRAILVREDIVLNDHRVASPAQKGSHNKNSKTLTTAMMDRHLAHYARCSLSHGGQDSRA